MCKARTYKRVSSRKEGDLNVQSNTVQESGFQAKSKLDIPVPAFLKPTLVYVLAL